MLAPTDADRLIDASVFPLPAIKVPLADLAGAVLREPLISTRDQPPFDRVTMDGIAFASATAAAGRRTFRIVGTQAAGAPPMTLSDTASCIEVMTGAMLPQGCDCVVPVERITVADNSATLTSDAPTVAWSNVHRTGVDSRAGTRLLDAGVRLHPADVASIAAMGLSHALVTQPPRIMLISTGDELIEPGASVDPWQIYRSNIYGILAALRLRGHQHVHHDHIADDLATLRERLREHLAHHDVLILSGGVSMGRFDFVPKVMEELGVKMKFHHISQRPGKPMWFGIGAAGQAVYALPGNPVSTLTCLVRYVYRGLDRAMGLEPAAPVVLSLSEKIDIKPALTVLMPVKAVADDSGMRVAKPMPTQGSGDFAALIGTDGIVELRPGPRLAARGERVVFYRW